jgi:hypothetical protein
MVKRMDEEKFNMKMEIFTMGNGIKARFMALAAIFNVKMIDFTKDFGREDNTVGKRLLNSQFLFNFFDINNIYYHLCYSSY